MPPNPFDPFGDRAAREIRNTLSAAFVAAWREGGADLPAVAAALQARHPNPVYRRWIVERLAAYRAAWRDRADREAPDLLDDLVRNPLRQDRAGIAKGSTPRPRPLSAGEAPAGTAPAGPGRKDS
jgi:hypothetical protein